MGGVIPVLGVPVLNRPDLLEVMLRSIDVEVERLVVIDNSGTGELANVALDVRPDAIVLDPPRNLGVAASWNLIIKMTADAPHWLLANADVRFGPGDLSRLSAATIGEDAVVAMLVEYGAFGLNRATLDAVGWFDENLHPIYCEDTDYRYRCVLAGVPERTVSPHSTTHVGSVSYRGNDNDARNARTYPANVAYYTRKWGGFRGAERYSTPFAAGGSLRDWTLDAATLRAQAWD